MNSSARAKNGKVRSFQACRPLDDRAEHKKWIFTELTISKKQIQSDTARDEPT